MVRPIISMFRSATILVMSTGGYSAKYCEPHRPFSSPRVPQENDVRFGTHAFGRALGISTRDGEQPGRTGAVVVRAVVHVVAIGQRRAEADVVQVRADDDVFVFVDRVAAFEHSDDVFAVALPFLHGDVQVERFSALIANESSFALFARAIENLRGVLNFSPWKIALVDRHAGGDGRHGGTRGALRNLTTW